MLIISVCSLITKKHNNIRKANLYISKLVEFVEGSVMGGWLEELRACDCGIFCIGFHCMLIF